MTENNYMTKVGLVQINNSFSNQNYLPLSVGMIQAYAQKYLNHPENYEFSLPIYQKMAPEAAAQQLMDADIALFSVYVWNFRISLETARIIKERNPNITIAFGGPHVPNNAAEFLRAHPYVDLACHGEGEQIALAILENFDSRRWDDVPGISYLGEDGLLVHNPKAARIKDLHLNPSPYLEGVFAPLMEANPTEQWIALWETNRGCPFSCSFCDWGSAVQSKVYPFELERLYDEVRWFAEHKIEFVFCCDANFGILPRDLDIAKFVAEIKGQHHYPSALSVQNTKNATERAYQTQKILSDAGLNKGVDIALQSLDAATLKSVKRDNISLDTYHELQRRFSRDGVETYTDLILGLPGETYDSFANGVSKVIENGQHNRVQFNNLSILPNSEMGDPEYQRLHGIVTVESNTINMHGSVIESEEEVQETQLLVIETSAMPREEWAKTRAFCWMAALLHFDKILQIPFILIHQTQGISYRELIESFANDSSESYPVLAEIRSLFDQWATNMQKGGPEYIHSEEWLNIWWPADEYALIKLCTEDKLWLFYEEAEKLLNALIREKGLSLPSDLLRDAVALNRSLIKLPLQMQDLDVELSSNIWEYYRSSLIGSPVSLDKKSHVYHIDRSNSSWPSWEEWYREVVWYGNKKGAYLYGNDAVEAQLAGHY